MNTVFQTNIGKNLNFFDKVFLDLSITLKTTCFFKQYFCNCHKTFGRFPSSNKMNSLQSTLFWILDCKEEGGERRISRLFFTKRIMCGSSPGSSPAAEIVYQTVRPEIYAGPNSREAFVSREVTLFCFPHPISKRASEGFFSGQKDSLTTPFYLILFSNFSSPKIVFIANSDTLFLFLSYSNLHVFLDFRFGHLCTLCW